jgi:CBS-domain-containing membrane protein
MKNLLKSRTNLKTDLLASLGAFLCIFSLAYLSSFDPSIIWLIPPFGASMVLVMGVHESPLAQPKNILFGHVLSALSGVVIFALLGSSPLSLGIAVALSVFVMASFNIIHPPAGANPIIAILGGKGIGFVLMPVAVGAIFIVIFAIIYNRMIGRNYP